MNDLSVLPLFVAVARPPSAKVIAVRIADLPEPLCPMMKLSCGPKSTVRLLNYAEPTIVYPQARYLWHIKL